MIGKLIDKWNRDDEDRFHFRISVAKSALRIVAGITLVAGSLVAAGIALIAAEILGVVEEL